MKNLFALLIVLLLSGCALTEVAKDYFTNAVDTNRYETARETAVNICDVNINDRLDNLFGEELAKQVRAKCAEKRTIPIPLN